MMPQSAIEPTPSLYLMIGRMESKVDLLLTKVNDLEKRMDELERSKQTATGVFSAAKGLWIVAAGVVGAFSDNIIHFFVGK